ncbi:MAG: hypothetical protein WD490_04635, partial [Opitutales bacterium]
MKFLIPILLLLGLSSCSSDKLSETPPTKTLRQVAEIPVLHDGRVMPLDTFSRLHMLQFSGRKSFNGEPAVLWMSRVLFEPETTENDAVFLINH